MAKGQEDYPRQAGEEQLRENENTENTGMVDMGTSQEHSKRS